MNKKQQQKIKKQNAERQAFIKNAMQRLDINEYEAQELWEYDNEEFEIEEHTHIKEEQKKEKDEKKVSPIAKVKTMKAKKKIDEQKQSILDLIFNFVNNAEQVKCYQQVTGTKASFKDAFGNYYSISVTKHKKKPDGFREEK